MRYIRYKHNYAYTVLDEKINSSGKLITGNSIPALLRTGEKRFKPFRGFIPYDDAKDKQLVKLVGIVGFSDTTWHELPKDNYCVGIYHFGSYKMLLRDGKPICTPE